MRARGEKGHEKEVCPVEHKKIARTRLEETMAFAERMRYRKLGLALGKSCWALKAEQGVTQGRFCLTKGGRLI